MDAIRSGNGGTAVYPPVRPSFCLGFSCGSGASTRIGGKRSDVRASSPVERQSLADGGSEFVRAGARCERTRALRSLHCAREVSRRGERGSEEIQRAGFLERELPGKALREAYSFGRAA